MVAGGPLAPRVVFGCEEIWELHFLAHLIGFRENMRKLNWVFGDYFSFFGGVGLVLNIWDQRERGAESVGCI